MTRSSETSTFGPPASGWRTVAIVSAAGLVALIALVVVLARVS